MRRLERNWLFSRYSAARQQRDRIGAALGTLRRRYQEALQEQFEARAESDKWRMKWQDCLTILGRPPGELPAAVDKAIELIAEAHRERWALGELEHRVAGMNENKAAFEAEVADLVAAVAQDPIDRPAEFAADELRRQLRINRDIEARRLGLLDDEREARAKLAEAASQLNLAKPTLEGIQREIGGGTDEEVATRIALAARRAAAEAKLAEIERTLFELGDGRRIEELEQETAAVEAGAIDTELARLRAEDDQIASDRDAVVRDEQRLVYELDQAKAAEDAIAAEECRQAAIAMASRIGGEALLYHAVASLLRHGIERLRDVGGNGLVQRIGAAFARITGGAYAGVSADEDDNGALFLVAIEADGGTEKRIDQLSDGTRDQLFLALRLVMVEDYAQKAPALPFVADDLLQTFDDYGRTANALTALSDLSRHVQVIVLSHHRQLIEIAGALPENTVNICDLAA